MQLDLLNRNLVYGSKNAVFVYALLQCASLRTKFELLPLNSCVADVVESHSWKVHIWIYDGRFNLCLLKNLLINYFNLYFINVCSTVSMFLGSKDNI